MEMMVADALNRAACRNEDPELFFPLTDVGPGARQAAEAKAVCARCPVVSACLAYAVEHGLAYGVFGGLTGSERRRPALSRIAS
jgi:WhiB family redox-sensing transcriptional regulator